MACRHKPLPLEPLPFIVVIIDELADMMMIVGKKVEELIARLAQKARAVGHSPDRRDPAALGRRHHRPDQGQHSLPDRLPGVGQGRFAHHSRPGRRREPARPRRHAVHGARHGGTRCGCTAPSCPTRRCTGSRGNSRAPASRVISMKCWRAPRRRFPGFPVNRRRAVRMATARPIRSTIRPCASWPKPAARPYPASSGA